MNLIQSVKKWWALRHSDPGNECGNRCDGGPRLPENLVLNPEQQAAWDRLAEVWRQNRGSLALWHETEREGAMTLPDRVEHWAGRLLAGLDLLNQLQPGLRAFYDWLDAEQRQRVDAWGEQRFAVGRGGHRHGPHFHHRRRCAGQREG